MLVGYFKTSPNYNEGLKVIGVKAFFTVATELVG